MSVNIWTPHWASDGAHNRLASQGQGMYHSSYNDPICTLALSNSDQLPQVMVTLVKGDNPILMDHAEAFVHLEQVWTKERRKKIDKNYIASLNGCSQKLCFHDE